MKKELKEEWKFYLWNIFTWSSLYFFIVIIWQLFNVFKRIEPGTNSFLLVLTLIIAAVTFDNHLAHIEIRYNQKKILEKLK